MKWKGKLIGFLLGLLTRRIALVLVGIAIGHLFDQGWFSSRPSRPSGPADAPPVTDCYAVLSLRDSASDDEVEQAYRRAMSEYHPDRVANAAQEIRDLAGTRAREINVAYEEIKRRRGI